MKALALFDLSRFEFPPRSVVPYMSPIRRSIPFRAVLAALTLATAVACGKEPERAAPSVPGEAPPASATPVPTSPDAIRAELKASVASARSHVSDKKLTEVRPVAARAWSLAAALRTAKAPYGHLPQLSRDLASQGDAGNATGASDVLAAIEREIESPSADQPDDKPPLSAHAPTYACPMNCEKGKTYDKPGQCPVCEMDLEPVVAGAFAHAHHEPQHGGEFIMAEDNWHHVEGTLPTAREFKLRLYDNFSMPMTAVGATATCRILVKPRKGSTPPEYTTVEMKPGPEGTTLVAPVPEGLPFPISTRAVISFPGKNPFTFDFQFPSLSVEPAPGAHGAEDTRPIPTGKVEILAALDEAAATAKAKAEAGTLKDLHALAARLAKLAAALKAVGGNPGRLEKLASDLHEQGDGGNKAGALEVVAEIAKDIAAAKK